MATTLPPDSDPPSHPVTLTFRDAALEAEFRAWLADTSRQIYRFLVGASLVLWALAVKLDLERGGTAALVMRFGVVTPILVAVLAASWTRPERFRRLMQPMLMLGVGAIGLGQVASAAIVRTNALLVVIGLCITLMAVHSVSRLRFVLGVTVGFVISVAWAVTLAAVGPVLVVPASDAAFLVVFSNLLGMVGSYSTERLLRRNFLQEKSVAFERHRSEQLLANMLPSAIAERLKSQPGRVADYAEDVTVLFADIVGFTALSQRLDPRSLVETLDDLFTRFDDVAERHGLEKIKTIGDAYMMVGGLPTRRSDHAVAIADAALEMCAALTAAPCSETYGLQMRIGIHSGPVVAGVIGRKKFSYDLWGDTVNIASRMESHGLAGMIQITEATRALLSGIERFRFERRGPIEVKGKGMIETWLLRASAQA